MNRCKDCRWWGTESFEVPVRGGGFRQLAHRPCTHLKTIDASARSYDFTAPDDAVLYSDAEQYRALLWTGPEFGCVHHEPTAHLPT